MKVPDEAVDAAVQAVNVMRQPVDTRELVWTVLAAGGPYLGPTREELASWWGGISPRPMHSWWFADAFLKEFG
jgi:hypothetical protein